MALLLLRILTVGGFIDTLRAARIRAALRSVTYLESREDRYLRTISATLNTIAWSN